MAVGMARGLVLALGVGAASLGGCARAADPRVSVPTTEVSVKATPAKGPREGAPPAPPTLETLRDTQGTAGLIAELLRVSRASSTAVTWKTAGEVFDLIEGSPGGGPGLNDPRGGDALAEYLAARPSIHWQTRAAMALAKIGDLRAVPVLAHRLRLDPLDLYDDSDEQLPLKRDDSERVVSARLLADLAVLHPERLPWIRAQSEEALVFWLHSLPSPHANGLRALAAMGSTADLDARRSWANPQVPLPAPGAQPPMPEEWVIAQTALRSIGRLRDSASYEVLERGLALRPKALDVSMDSLMQGGLAILGMSLRAVALGAAQGLAEWGEPKAFAPLLAHAQDRKNNEHSRLAACAALPWTGSEVELRALAAQAVALKGTSKHDLFLQSCLVAAFLQRPVPSAGELSPLLSASTELATRRQVARALGRAGLSASLEAQLVALLADPDVGNDAALALLLGGTAETVARAIPAVLAKEPDAAPRVAELAEIYGWSFGFLSDADLERGALFRWVDNALALAGKDLDDEALVWARRALEAALANLEFDSGPHSLTRVVLRYRLRVLALGADPALQQDAVQTLLLMKEQGTLMALAAEPGSVGTAARLALQELTGTSP